MLNKKLQNTEDKYKQMKVDWKQQRERLGILEDREKQNQDRQFELQKERIALVHKVAKLEEAVADLKQRNEGQTLEIKKQENENSKAAY